MLAAAPVTPRGPPSLAGARVSQVTRSGPKSLAAARVRVTRRGPPSLAAGRGDFPAAARLTGDCSGPPSLASARHHSARPVAGQGHSSRIASPAITRRGPSNSPRPVSLADVILARRSPSHSGTTRPAITRRGPSFTSHSPRPAAAPSESPAEARSNSQGP